MTEVCVDTSFALKLVLHEPEQARVRARWSDWSGEGVTVIAPWLFVFEAVSVLRRKVARGQMTEDEGLQAWRLLRRQGVRTAHPRGLLECAWAIASALGRPTAYDSAYLALAELRECELWTADERFASAAKHRYRRIRSL